MGEVNQTQDILFGQTPTLVYDAPAEHGRPSSPSVAIYENTDGDDGTAETATGSASVETNPNTTIDAACGLGQADQRIVYVAATTGITAGRRFLVTDNSGAGATEWVDVVDVASAVSFTARHPLRNAYSTGDLVQSTRITATFLSAWTSDTNNLSYALNPNPRYRAVFSYTDAKSIKRGGYVYFDLVRWPTTTGVTGLDVDAASPGWLDSMPTYYRAEQGMPLVREALRQVKMDLYGEEKADQMIRNSEALDDLVLHKAIVLAEASKITNGGGSEPALNAARSMYEDRWNQLVKAKTVAPFAQSGGGAAVAQEPLRITRR